MKKKKLFEECSRSAAEFISGFVDIDAPSTQIISATILSNLKSIEQGTLENLINIKKVNNIRKLNKYFEAINQKLPYGGLFIGCVETYERRRERLFNKYPMLISKVCYFIDFILNRILPKCKWTKTIYFTITKGYGRVLSKAETLGRLVSCGFTIISISEISGLLYFIVKKIKEPAYDLNPSYGPLFKMKRTGRYGEIIQVYKFRTMHPYSEYLHDYILDNNGYSATGKPAEDFRVTGWGKLLRKYWLDELPQIINILKGEMNLVGIRPLSQRFLEEYPADVLKMRSKYKPGCVPPYIALLKQEVGAYIDSERIYFAEKERHPYLTDYKYLVKACYNIMTNRIRSS